MFKDIFKNIKYFFKRKGKDLKMKEKLKKLLADGALTQEEYDTLISNLQVSDSNEEPVEGAETEGNEPEVEEPTTEEQPTDEAEEQPEVQENETEVVEEPVDEQPETEEAPVEEPAQEPSGNETLAPEGNPKAENNVEQRLNAIEQTLNTILQKLQGPVAPKPVENPGGQPRFFGYSKR